MGKEERTRGLMFRFAHCYETKRLPGWISCSARPLRLSFYGEPTEQGFDKLCALARGYGLVPDVGCIYIHAESGPRRKGGGRSAPMPILIIGCPINFKERTNAAGK